ncbi:hypothetical protein SAY86_003488 [Trapa natans]|uniref:RING-type E3 ubiquitin transferase n=1 Tax=Trapa natans TaxID=22666 RepID=A0AAN7RMU5_TRANT|nr:hypothetical protein SAY86_003488 [Trapa natans]
MGSQVNQQSNWIPYISNKDCSQEICSLYCPQWCYPAFTPPPLQFPEDDGSSSVSTPTFPPLIIAIVGILASAFLIVTYYTIISKYCGSSSNNPSRTESPRDLNLGPDGGDAEASHGDGAADHEPWYVSTGGLDEALIRSIAVCKYKRGAGMVEGTCSVCLSEFQEEESVRLLPKCGHAFHIPCIDKWLKSHSSCPLCRSEVAFSGSLSVLVQIPSAARLSDSHESASSSSNLTGQEEVGNSPSFKGLPSTGSAEETTAIFSRRSFSAGHSCHQTLADMLKVEDQDEEDHQVQGSTSSAMIDHNGGPSKNPLETCKIGHKSGFLHCMIDRPSIDMKRSLSSGRFDYLFPGMEHQAREQASQHMY